jgi:predicted DCC family thiol-disulfide oxidoreductase YuxK
VALVYERESTDPRRSGAAWTGGQYSVARAVLGVVLAASFVRLLPWDPRRFDRPDDAPPRGSGAVLDVLPNLFRVSSEPRFVTGVVVVGAVASVLLAVGARARVAAALVAYVWACFANWSAATAPPGGTWTLVLVAATLIVPPAPYLSWDARGRADPEGAWHLPLPFFQLAWGLLVLTCVASVFEQFSSHDWGHGPATRARVAAGFAVDVATPFLVWRRPSRRVAWCALVVVRVAAAASAFAVTRDRASLLLLLFAFDPAWLQPKRPRAREHLFFDGDCGLCHRVVRFVAAEDRAGSFFFSPLQGDTMRTLTSDEQRAALPDSVVVRADDGRLVVTSDAWIHVLERLGGLWRLAAALLAAVPRPLRELGYRLVARWRRVWFARPDGRCPLLSQRLRTRFLP